MENRVFNRVCLLIVPILLIIGLFQINTVSVYSEDTTDYLCFTAVEDGSSVQLTIGQGSPTVVSLEYKKNNGSWSTYNIDDVIDLNNNDKVYFRNTSETTTGFGYYDGYNAHFYKFVMTGKIVASGDITTLINKNGTKILTTDYCFAYLFDHCDSLISISENFLPATTLTNSCYEDMFNCCGNLTTAAKLPSTIMAKRCYTSMFSHCPKLVSTPELPATVLADSCYAGMFGFCESLSSVPALPTTELAAGCYNGMFASCTGISSAPELPATVLTDWCYKDMFANCTGLSSAPELPAMTLASDCYEQMFMGCTNLSSAPELPATVLADGCYTSMFYDCINLISFPELPATALAQRCYEKMFSGCLNIKLSDVQDGTYIVPVRIPSSGSISTRYIDDFSEIFKDTGGPSSFTSTGTPVDSDSDGVITLYMKPFSVTITYNGNGNDGGTVPTDAGPYSSGDNVIIKDNINSLTKTGYVFMGWNTKSDGTGTTYQPSDILNIMRDTTLYAKWGNYSFTIGGNQTYVKGTLVDKLFTCDGPLANLTSVKVDDVEITETTQYTKESGSTKITLLGTYLETLGLGSHTLKLTYSDGPTPTVTFNVVNPSGNNGGNNSGGNSNNNKYVVPNTGIKYITKGK